MYFMIFVYVDNYLDIWIYFSLRVPSTKILAASTVKAVMFEATLTKTCAISEPVGADADTNRSSISLMIEPLLYNRKHMMWVERIKKIFLEYCKRITWKTSLLDHWMKKMIACRMVQAEERRKFESNLDAKSVNKQCSMCK